MAGTPEYEQALQDVHTAEVDLNYTQYSPLTEKYESIYRNKTSSDVQPDDTRRSRPAMWTIVEDCMEAGTLEALREGKLAKPMSIRREKPTQNKESRKSGRGLESSGVLLDSTKKHSRQSEQPRESDDDDQSDGGFFER